MKQKLTYFLAVIFMTLAGNVFAAEPKTIIAFGDSITAGYGVTAAEAFPAVLEKKLNDAGMKVKIQNAGVSGETTQGGLARLDWTLAGGKPALFMLGLGANDALRGVDPAITRKNLTEMLTKLQAQKIPVLLLGMISPRNMGTHFSHDYDTIYADLAKQFNVPLYPFLLDGVAMDPALNQGDGIHPNPKGAEFIAGRLVEPVRKALGEK